MYRFLLAFALSAVITGSAWAVSGDTLALRSIGSSPQSGDWTLSRDGYVGTYFQLNAPGDVTINVNAAGTAAAGIDPNMNIVIADTKAGFNVAAGFNTYQHTFNLPAGTYLVRAEMNNDLEQSSRALTIRDLSVTGATLLNSSSNANALATADTYIQNFRKGNVTIALPGAALGATVDVSLKRHAFSFGTAVPGVSYAGVANYLGNNGTARQVNYQQRLNQYFNAVTPENAGKWGSNEDVRDENPDAPMNGMDNVDLMLDYAQSHNMRARMHNLIWGDNSFNGQQPSWVLNNSASGLLDLAATGNATAKAELRAEISERIDHYIGSGTPNDRAHKYLEVDIYNESYHTGADPSLAADLKRNYWNVYGATGIADIYREARDAIAASGAPTKIFVNEYGVLGSGDYAGWYFDHIQQLRQAGVTAGYGDVVGGIGVQHYPGGSQNAGNIYRTLQNLAVQGLPMALTEFGVSTGVSQSIAANILEESMRLVFGTADATGFFMWGFHQESGTGATTLFAPSAALFTVNTSDFNTWTTTAAGTRYEWLFGMGPDPTKGGTNSSPWDTELMDLVVDANGTINFSGFWGDYELTIGGQTYLLTLNKGNSLYSVVVAPGDYNGDGTVDAADYLVWRRTLDSTTDLRADGNGNGVIDANDYSVWQSYFGATYGNGSASATAPVPEPQAVLLYLTAAVVFAASTRVRRQSAWS